jgi:hypothetical protein
LVLLRWNVLYAEKIGATIPDIFGEIGNITTSSSTVEKRTGISMSKEGPIEMAYTYATCHYLINQKRATSTDEKIGCYKWMMGGARGARFDHFRGIRVGRGSGNIGKIEQIT